ncbi:MAG: hypothetical protein JXA58_08545 [Dehalococcoidia bacterium]|nr:hypothetical protein [Dehalococcoidia bacterium]
MAGSALLLAVGCLAAWHAPFRGYESSIYAGTPTLFWVAYGTAVVVSVAVFGLRVSNSVEAAVSRTIRIAALCLALLGFCSVLGLWMLRGGFFWGIGDALVHLRDTQSVIDAGHLSKLDLYPVVKALVAESSLVTGVDPFLLFRWFPLILGLGQLSFFYVLARRLRCSPAVTVWLLLLGCTFLGGWYVLLSPNQLGVVWWPLAIAVIVGARSVRTGDPVLGVLTVGFLPVVHALVAVGLGLVAVGFALSDYAAALLRRITKNVNRNVLFGLSAMLLCWTVTWLSDFGVWETLWRNMLAVLAEGKDSNLDKTLAMAMQASAEGYSVIEYGFRLYGGSIAICALALVAVLSYLQHRMYAQEQWPVSAVAIAAIPLILVMILLYLVTVPFGPLRLLVLIVVACMPAAAWQLADWSMVRVEVPRSWLRRVAAVGLVVCLTCLGPLRIYQSTYTLEQSQQIARAEWFGMKWFVQYKSQDIHSTALTLAPGQFSGLFLSEEEGSGRTDLLRYVPEQLRLPYHFGYDTGTRLGSKYPAQVYLVLGDRDILLYEELFPEMASKRFTAADFARLESDTSIDRICDCLGLVTRMIRPVT